MNFEADDLLDMVDEWRFKLKDKLDKMTPDEQRKFWRQSEAKALAMGLTVVKKLPKSKPKPRPVSKKRRSKAS